MKLSVTSIWRGGQRGFGYGRWRRLAVAAVVAAGAVTVVASPPVGAARDVTDACTDGVAEDGFTDSGDEGSAIESAVDCIADYGVTSGKTDTSFAPSESVSRAQMATFLMRTLDLVAGFERPVDAPDAFSDDEGSVHEDNINDAAAVGVTAGKTATTFGPSDQVTRAQMASFIVNQLATAGVAIPDGAPDVFPDDDDDTHEENINILADDGGFDIADGTSATTYAPRNNVTRGQMAFFLSRDLDLLVEEGLVEPIDSAASSDQDEDLNQDFDVDATETELLVNDETDGVASKTVTFSGFGDTETVDVMMSPCPHFLATGGSIEFVGADRNGRYSYGGGNFGGTTGDAFIAEINGDDFDTYFESDIDVESDEVVVRVENEPETADCVRVVVWADVDDSDTVAVGLDLFPTEEFAVSGQIAFTQGEAPTGTDPVGLFVAYSDPTDADGHAGLFVLEDGFTYYYDSSDDFSFLGSTNLTLTEFDAFLSMFDDIELDTAYSQTADNSFDLALDYGYPYYPGLSVEVGDFDSDSADTGANDLELTFTPQRGMAPDCYCWSVYDDQRTPTDRSDDTYADGACGSPGSDILIAEDLDQGGYLVYGSQYNHFTGPTGASTPGVRVSITAPAAGAPISQSATFDDADTDGAVSSGDTLTVVFDENMTDPVGGANFTLSDGDGTVATVINTVNATFSVTDNTLTVVVTGAPEIAAAGTAGGVQYGSAVVVDRQAITDFADLAEWDLVGSTDKTF